MILSNEPGYYKEGAFGIRLENLIVVTPAPEIDGQDARTMLSFETLTWVSRPPHDLKSALSPDEIAVDAYHAEVAQRIEPRLEAQQRNGLQRPPRRWSRAEPRAATATTL